MPSILTIKQQEAVNACNKMNTSFVSLNTQINVTHNDGYKPLESNTNLLNTTESNMFNEAINMNDLPTG